MAEAVGDYVLGTCDAELSRLGLQHRVWRAAALAAWRKAGLLPGWRVIDIGAGPGYATWDLSDLVGDAGSVVAVERSPRFAELMRRESRRRGLRHLTVLEGDLMELTPPGACDFAWCRWVASFVPSVRTLVRWIHASLRPEGVAVFHEYADYGSWRWAPARPLLEDFVREVMASWRDTGGEPDVAPALISALRDEGFRLQSVRPLVFATTPRDLTWQWPASFVETNALRLQELGRVQADWVGKVRSEMAAAQLDLESVMVTPMVLEVIAVRP